MSFSKNSNWLILLLFLGPWQGWSQGNMNIPDLELAQLYRVDEPRTRTLRSPTLSADLKLFCDGKQLFLYLHVHDPRIILSPDVDFSDHIQLWLALPDRAFPSDFEYELHPNYVMAEPRPTRATDDDEPRFFTIFSEYGSEVSLQNFLQEHDYPSTGTAAVPDSRDLSLREVHFGMIGYALFPDERSPELLNRQELEPIEAALHTSLGQVEEGITYKVTHHSSGSYEVNAQISPQALGFVQLPEMSELAVMIDIIDVAGRGQRGRLALSSSPYRQGHAPNGYNQVRLQTPLQTNYTTIPNEFFEETSYFPICFFSGQDWVGTGVDVDALTYREYEASRSLAEVRFSRENFAYDRRRINGAPLENMVVEQKFVNEIPKRHQFTLLYDYLLETEQITAFLANTSAVSNSLFTYPDGALGLILINSLTVDPFGWGDCGTCVEEIITVHRLSEDEQRLLLEVYQTDGPVAYCQIENFRFDNFYVEAIDWIREGEIMVMRLSHRYQKEKKRVKVSWNPETKALDVLPIE